MDKTQAIADDIRVENGSHITKLQAATDTLEIYKLLKIETRLPKRADAVICFGSNSDKPPYIAAGLYHAGIVNLIAVTGWNPNTNRDEAIIYREILLRNDVPRKDMIVEADGSNTLENVENTRNLLLKRFAARGLETPPLTIIPVSASFAELRQTMTLKAHMPYGCRYYPCGFTPDSFSGDDWHLEKENIKLIHREKGKIFDYLDKKHLAEISKEGDTWT